MSTKPDLVAHWRLQLSNGQKYKIEFEHGTTSGKRVVYVNNKEVFRKDWMFKLVGKQEFQILGEKSSKSNNKNKQSQSAVSDSESIIGRIEILPHSSFTYEYSLFINGKSYEKFKKEKSKTSINWIVGSKNRITLEKTSMNVYVNGELVEEAESIFGEEGVETHFRVEDGEINKTFECCIKNVSSGDKREGLMHLLFVGGVQVGEV